MPTDAPTMDFAGLIPEPGALAGPCAGGCRHRECAEFRRVAEAPCRVCGAAIGYAARFCQGGDWTFFAHEDCLHAYLTECAIARG